MVEINQKKRCQRVSQLGKGKVILDQRLEGDQATFNPTLQKPGSIPGHALRENIMLVWWRFKGVGPWHFGFRTAIPGRLVRMGRWNGDTSGGTVVDPNEIETRSHHV